MHFRQFRSINSIWFGVILAFYFFFFLNQTLTNKLIAIIGALETDFIFILTIPLFFICALTFIFTPFIFRPITKPFFIALILSSSVVNYTTYQFGIIFNKDMLDNFAETNTQEALSYLNIRLVLWIGATGVLPAFFVALADIRYEPILREVMRKLVLMATCLGIIGLIAAFYYKDYATIARNNPKIQKDIIPTYFLSSTFKFVKQRYFSENAPYQTLSKGAERIKEKEKYLMIVLVGETARAQNYQALGYNRPTNTHTQNIKNLFFFHHVTSCGTATAVSLPCMFSFLGKDLYSREKFDSQDNVTDFFKASGFNAVWIDNNTGSKGVAHNIKSLQASDCDGEPCPDSVTLPLVQDAIKDFKGNDGIIFVHLIGSHGPTYFMRYPSEHAFFKPECRTSDIRTCTHEQILNTYDNTILYTDYIMSQMISILENHDTQYHTALLYVSDHGESLGEHGVYLHGLPYALAPQEQTHVPLALWMSDKMMRHKKIDVSCVKRKQLHGSFSHDNVTHTILDLMDIKDKSVLSNKNIIETCINEHD